MLAFLRLLVAFAILVMLLPDWPASAQGLAGASRLPSAASGDTSTWSWLVGLVTGMILMAAARVRWRELPTRIVAFLRSQSHRAGWAALGLCYTCILLFF
jgi:hypothetical protein